MFENIFINDRKIYFIIVFNKQTNHMYSNMAIRISITEILTEELLMSVLVSSLSSLTLMKKSSPYWQLSTFMLIMSLIIDCMRRYKIVFVYQMVLLMMLFWFLFWCFKFYHLLFHLDVMNYIKLQKENSF